MARMHAEMTDHARGGFALKSPNRLSERDESHDFSQPPKSE